MADAIRYNLKDIVEAELKKDSGIQVETADGQVFTIPPVSLWPDEAFELQRTGDIVSAAHALLGDRYEDFKAAGGSAALLMHVIGASQGATIPES